MTDTETAQVQQIREREQQATKGPWGVRFDHDVTGYPCYFIRGVSGDGKRDVQSLAANARFIEGARTGIPFLLALLARQQAEIDRLRGERDEAMRVLSPNMPESGLVDACKQVKQVAISEKDNSEWAESSLSALREAIQAQLDWTLEPREHPHITSFKEVERRLRALLASPTPEDR